MSGPGSETIVITGASSGIGREIALQLAAPDRNLWLIARDQNRLAEVAASAMAAGASVFTRCIDLSDLGCADNFLKETFPPGNPVDSVYLVAAVSLFGEVRDMVPDDWDRLYHTNLLSPLQWTEHFYRQMIRRKHGRIVLVSSLAGYAGYPTATAYAAMKAGLVGMFRSLRHEARQNGVSLHLAAPGYVDTRIYQRATYRGTDYEKTMTEIRNLGLPVVGAAGVAEKIISRVARGRTEFAVPAYASAMRWIAPRFPWIISLVHRRIVRNFRRIS